MTKLLRPTCPVCKARANGILETMLVRYELDVAEDGSFDYTGETQEYDETAEPLFEKGHVTVSCEAGHEWPTVLIGGNDEL